MADELYTEAQSIISKLDIWNISSAELAQLVADALRLVSNTLEDSAHRSIHETIVSWEDLQFPPETFNLAGSASPPTLDALVMPGTLLFSGTLENNIAGIRQIPHQWMAGTELRPHIHYAKTTSGPGDIVWQMKYTLANVGDVFPAYTDWVSATSYVPHSNTTGKHAIAAFPPIDMTGKRESCFVCIQVRRLPSDPADTYADPARFFELDMHYKTNKDGTETEFPGSSS